jgi:energy-coupling factor transporter ATP-binding protein EcfA2
VGFEIYPGEYVGVVGANGCGKSTLIRLLNGLLTPDSGSVSVSGYDPVSEARKVRRVLGVMFQSPDNGLVAPFVEDDVAFGLENLGVARGEMVERVRRAISGVGLAGYEQREVSTLSGGEKQRVALAGLLAVEPEVLALDEPTSMLDPPGRSEVLQRIRSLRGSHTILHVTHHLEELVAADRVLVMGGGRVVAETTPIRLLSDPELLEENRLVAPPASRLATSLGFGSVEAPEELAELVLERLGEETISRVPGYEK